MKLGGAKDFWPLRLNGSQDGVSLTELLVGLVIAGVLMAGIMQFAKTGIFSSKRSMQQGNMDASLSRFTTLMQKDLEKAGSDPTGAALQAYIYEDTCQGKLIFKYGIVPEPADPGCIVRLGDIGILSYSAYDQNGDGNIDPEEGLDLSSGSPIPKTITEDYIVYELRGDKIYRKNIGDPDSHDDDSEELVLDNAVSFLGTYYGYDDEGVYGEVTETSRYDDIREVEISIVVHGGVREKGYVNPLLESDSPYTNYRTEERTFRVPLIVRKE